jgi:hypothetical protein
VGSGEGCGRGGAVGLPDGSGDGAWLGANDGSSDGRGLGAVEGLPVHVTLSSKVPSSPAALPSTLIQ